MRKLAAYHDAGMSYWVAVVAWEMYERPDYIEMRGAEGFAQDLGLNLMRALEINQAVVQEV